ncbi:MAG: RNA-binding protein [Verrucomicrobiota bacterium]|nr:RNA-binding protein [Verrucomicrobiota bacterium]
MATYSSGRNSRRPRAGSGSRRRTGDDRPARSKSFTPQPAAKKSLWEKITGFFTNESPGTPRGEQTRKISSSNGSSRDGQPERPARKAESVEVTTPRLYVGNLSFEATESDLFELFNGVGQVQNAEVVTYKHNQRSKGFAFVQMLTVEEAQRAVTELHDKEFLGRKLLVSGAKSSEHHSAS